MCIRDRFVLLKADCLLHSQEGKKAWERNYQMGNEQAKLFAAAPVLKKASTEGFFRIFSKYTKFASKMESSYAGYTFPAFDDFTVTERFDSPSSLRSQALGDKLLRADFTCLLYTSREHINSKIRLVLDEATDPWGITFCSHLLFHGGLNVARRRDILDFDTIDLDTPRVCRFVEHESDL